MFFTLYRVLLLVAPYVAGFGTQTIPLPYVIIQRQILVISKGCLKWLPTLCRENFRTSHRSGQAPKKGEKAAGRPAACESCPKPQQIVHSSHRPLTLGPGGYSRVPPSYCQVTVLLNANVAATSSGNLQAPGLEISPDQKNKEKKHRRDQRPCDRAGERPTICFCFFF